MVGSYPLRLPLKSGQRHDPMTFPLLSPLANRPTIPGRTARVSPVVAGTWVRGKSSRTGKGGELEYTRERREQPGAAPTARAGPQTREEEGEEEGDEEEEEEEEESKKS